MFENFWLKQFIRRLNEIGIEKVELTIDEECNRFKMSLYIEVCARFPETVPMVYREKIGKWKRGWDYKFNTPKDKLTHESLKRRALERLDKIKGIFESEGLRVNTYIPAEYREEEERNRKKRAQRKSEKREKKTSEKLPSVWDIEIPKDEERGKSLPNVWEKEILRRTA
jgi:hypothetical protein